MLIHNLQTTGSVQIEGNLSVTSADATMLTLNRSTSAGVGITLTNTGGDLANISALSDKSLDFRTSGSSTVGMNIDASQNVSIPNGNLNVDTIRDAAGTGAPDFQFGITLSGGSSVLDDYEEGTHTPTVTPSSSGTITMYGSQTLSYIKIGNLCQFQGEILASSVSSPTGYIQMSLPFTSVNSLFGDEPEEAPFQVQIYNVSGNNVSRYVGFIPRASSTAQIYLGDGTNYQSDSAQTIVANSAIVVMGVYRTA